MDPLPTSQNVTPSTTDRAPEVLAMKDSWHVGRTGIAILHTEATRILFPESEDSN